MASVSASHSGSWIACRRARPRRCASALGDSAWPHSATVRCRRVAVSMSCSGLAARVAISTSPAAVTRRLVAAATAFTRSRTSSSSPCISSGIASHARSRPNQVLSHCACANSDSNDKTVEGRGGGGLDPRLGIALQPAAGGGSSRPSPVGPSRASRVSRPRGRPAPGALEAIAAAALARAAAMTPMPDSRASMACAPSADRTASPEVSCPTAPRVTGPAVGTSSARQSGRPARCGRVGVRPSRSLVRAS